MIHAADDPSVPLDNSLAYAVALRAARVPVELHMFEEGGHGFGIALARGKPAAAWPDLFLAWARRRGNRLHLGRGLQARRRARSAARRARQRCHNLGMTGRDRSDRDGRRPGPEHVRLPEVRRVRGSVMPREARRRWWSPRPRPKRPGCRRCNRRWRSARRYRRSWSSSHRRVRCTRMLRLDRRSARSDEHSRRRRPCGLLPQPTSRSATPAASVGGGQFPRSAPCITHGPSRGA